MVANNKAVEPRRDDFVITIPPKEPSEKQLPPAAAAAGAPVDVPIANGGSANPAAAGAPVDVPIANGGSANPPPRREVGTYILESIPEWVRAVNRGAYSPTYISIGPIHRPKDGNHPLHCTALKNDYLRSLMMQQGLDKDACLKDLADKEDETRSFYNQDFTINREDWAEMLLLDGCFVVMYLLGIEPRNSTHTRWVWAVLRIDLILLENQLPFSVLVCIMRHVLCEETEEEASDFLTRLVVNYWVYRGSVGQFLKKEEFQKVKVNHLVHLIHLAHYRMIYGDEINQDSRCGIVCGFLICMWKTRSGICHLPILAMMLLSWPFRLLCQFVDPGEKKKIKEKKEKKNEEEDDEDDDDDDEDDGEKNVPSATEVHNLGISFRKKHMRLGPKSPYDVHINFFDKNTLNIPRLVVSISEKPLLHNLIAWEHATPSYRNYDKEGHFTKYAFLMYNLINKPDDIALLQREGILLNKLGTDDEVVNYFKELVQWNSRDPKRTTTSSETLLQKVQNFCLPKKYKESKIDEVIEVLKHRVEQPEYQYWAEVKKYLSSPLQVLLVVTSLVVFVSTLLPAIQSVHTTK